MEEPSDLSTNSEPDNGSVSRRSGLTVITLDLFPARKLFAVGVLASVMLSLAILRRSEDLFDVLFALFVMRTVEDCFLIAEDRWSIKTGIFESKVKYFVFLDGGVGLWYLLIRAAFPHGIGTPLGVAMWFLLLIPSLLIGKRASEAAVKRCTKVQHLP